MQLWAYVKVVLTASEELISSGLLAEVLSECGAEAFEETSSGLEAYFPSQAYDEQSVVAAIGGLPSAKIVAVEQIQPRNWNAEWESTVTPVLVQAAGKLIQVRASFHEADPTADFHVLIDPKMAFGTGHHATTAMMMALVVECASTAHSCLDMGCGSGILAILASQLGVPYVLAMDNDAWACSNASENVAANGADSVVVRMGDISDIPQQEFELILANLTRNLLADHMQTLVEHLAVGGHLAVSGFYQIDESYITDIATQCGLSLRDVRSKEGWAAILFERAH